MVVRSFLNAGASRTQALWLSRTRSALVLLALLVVPRRSYAGRPLSVEHYKVVAGDSLWGIAHDHGCRVDDLRRANPEHEGALRVGTRLVIPRCRRSSASATRTHEVQVGESLSVIAMHHGVSVAELRALNDLADDLIHPGQHLRVRGARPEPVVRVVVGQSRGRPQRGSLMDGAQLPYSPQYFRRRPQWAWGAQHVIDHTRHAIAQVHRQFPALHRLAIGDLSAARGGRLPGHGSHQSGRDVDLGLFFRQAPAGYPQEFVKASEGQFHASANWTLVQALYRASRRSTGPYKVFVDYDVQRRLYEAARQSGVSVAALKPIFQYPDGRWAQDRFVQHVPQHADHFHVRFKCPPEDEGCR